MSKFAAPTTTPDAAKNICTQLAKSVHADSQTIKISGPSRANDAVDSKIKDVEPYSKSNPTEDLLLLKGNTLIAGIIKKMGG